MQRASSIIVPHSLVDLPSRPSGLAQAHPRLIAGLRDLAERGAPFAEQVREAAAQEQKFLDHLAIANPHSLLAIVQAPGEWSRAAGVKQRHPLYAALVVDTPFPHEITAHIVGIAAALRLRDLQTTLPPRAELLARYLRSAIALLEIRSDVGSVVAQLKEILWNHTGPTAFWQLRSRASRPTNDATNASTRLGRWLDVYRDAC